MLVTLVQKLALVITVYPCVASMSTLYAEAPVNHATAHVLRVVSVPKTVTSAMTIIALVVPLSLQLIA